MKEQWIKLSARVDALSLRERIMVFVAAVGVVLFVAYNFMLEPMFSRQRLLNLELKQHQARVVAIDGEILAHMRANSEDPDQASKVQLAALRKQYADKTAALRAMQHGLVSPDQMSELLEQMLRANGKLKLVSLRTLPVTGASAALADGGEGAPAMVVPGAPAGTKPRELLYRHSVELVVRGSYLDMVAYMDALEHLPSQLFWGKAQLDAGSYPDATLTLTLSTLSLDQKWMTL